MKNDTGILKYVALIAVYVALGGCVAGQTLKFDYVAEQTAARKSTTPISVDVKDKRPFVVDGKKKPSYIGHYRAGFGNTWDVHTDGNEALAALMARDLSADLVALGFNVSKERARRTVSATIVDWNFDSYINATYWYECLVSVQDETGKVLANATLKDKSVIQGNVMVGPKYAVEKEMPKVYQSVIRKMVRENPSILRALEQ